MTEYDITGVVFSRPDVVVAQAVVLQQGLHGVGGAADIAGVHGLCIIQLLLSSARLVAVGCISALARASSHRCALQQHVLQVGLLGSRDRRSLHASCSSVATSSSSLGGLRQTVRRPVLAPAAPGAASVAGDVAAVEDAVLFSQVSLQQRDGVESFAAEAARELLAVRGDVTLELHFCSEALPAEDALPGLESCQRSVITRMNRWHRNRKYQTFHITIVYLLNAAQPDSTCTEASREARPLAQMVMFNVQLKIRLLPEVPGTRCAAKQLLLVAVLHCQMHLHVRPEKHTQQINFASFGIRVCKTSHSTTSRVSFTWIDTLESKTS